MPQDDSPFDRILRFTGQMFRRRRVRHEPRPYYYLGPDIAMTRLVDGHHLYVDPRDESVGVYIITRGFWENHVGRILAALVSEGDHVVDVGSNIGYHAVAMAARVGRSGSVTAIEANPHLARLAAMSLRFNRYDDRTSVIQKAASDTAGTVRFTTSGRNGGGGHLHFPNSTLGEDTQILEVETVRLDDLDLPSIRLIRIDTEGAEAMVLRGAERLLQRRDVVVCMEWDTIQMSSRSDPALLIDWLAAMGFRFWRITHASELIEVVSTEVIDLPFCDLLLSRSPVQMPSSG